MKWSKTAPLYLQLLAVEPARNLLVAMEARDAACVVDKCDESFDHKSEYCLVSDFYLAAATAGRAVLLSW